MSLEDLGIKNKNARAQLLAKTLDAATGKLFDNNKSPSSKTGQLDNRGSQFLPGDVLGAGAAARRKTRRLPSIFAPLAKALADNEKISWASSPQCRASRLSTLMAITGRRRQG